MELTELPGVGAVRKHFLNQAGYTTVEIVASRSVADIQKVLNVNYATARRIFVEAMRLTGADEYRKITGAGTKDNECPEGVRMAVEGEYNLGVPGLNDNECMEVALKELEEQGLITDRHGDDWKPTDKGRIEHKKLMVLLGM